MPQLATITEVILVTTPPVNLDERPYNTFNENDDCVRENVQAPGRSCMRIHVCVSTCLKAYVHEFYCTE